ncbi:ninja-family protein AFP2-like [Solanum lycopersicum]|uniref:ninja-family protein AFP2-like n=1 Tax=Solanum lycopersicum TaxID=4081 RepID=UPI003749CDC0
MEGEHIKNDLKTGLACEIADIFTKGLPLVLFEDLQDNRSIRRSPASTAEYKSYNPEKSNSIVVPPKIAEKRKETRPTFVPKSNGESAIKFNGKGDLLRTMPCGTTFGGIINGKLTEGIIYSDGEEKRISILCICHGMFYRTAEFVKHGGGKEVDDPMKFIKEVDDA